MRALWRYLREALQGSVVKGILGLGYRGFRVRGSGVASLGSTVKGLGLAQIQNPQPDHYPYQKGPKSGSLVFWGAFKELNLRHRNGYM